VGLRLTREHYLLSLCSNTASERSLSNLSPVPEARGSAR
jgi:hypothetical protein